MPERLCRNLSCGCEPAPGLAYCDPVCAVRDRAAGESPEERCSCGHDACRPLPDDWDEKTGLPSP